MKQQKDKILFIFPQSGDAQPTHYPYWFNLIEEVGKTIDSAVLFESGKPVNLKNTSICQSQKITSKPLNLLERLFLINKLTAKGYSKIYIHYSYWSVFVAKLISFFRPITIYYWNCEKYETKPSDRLLPLALKFSDVLLTGSVSIADSYKNLFRLEKKPIKIIPNWVEKKQAKVIKLPKEKTHILFVHHLSPRKGSRELPQIIETSIKANPNLQFHIIGAGPDLEYLKKKASKKYLKDKVVFYGNLPNQEVASYFQSTDVFIMPSQSEGFPRVILEAMINKLPIVSTKVGCVEEIVSELQREYLVDPNDPHLFALTLIQFIKLKNKSKLIEENYKRAEIYNLENSRRALLKALDL